MWHKILNRCFPRREFSISTLENPLFLANQFNKFYANVGKVTALKEANLNIQDTVGIHTCEADRTSGENNAKLFEFQFISMGDVNRIIKNLPSNKAPGCVKVNAKVVKDSTPVIVPIVTSLILQWQNDKKCPPTPLVYQAKVVVLSYPNPLECTLEKL